MMNSVSSIVRRYPLVVFFIIAYATSFSGGYLSERYPSDWWALFVYGPFIGGFIVTAIDEGRHGLKTWLSRIVRWRVGIKWYLVALLLPVILHITAFGLNQVFGAAMPSASQLSAWPTFLPQFIFMMLFIGLAEEPGFRGFALQRLLSSRTALAASLIVGVLVTIWHLPLFVYGGEQVTIIPVIIAGSVLLAWVYVHTNGSVLLTMIMHSSLNMAVQYFNSLYSSADFARHNLLLGVVFVAAALLVVLLSGTNLIREPEMQPAVG